MTTIKVFTGFNNNTEQVLHHRISISSHNMPRYAHINPFIPNAPFL